MQRMKCWLVVFVVAFALSIFGAIMAFLFTGQEVLQNAELQVQINPAAKSLSMEGELLNVEDKQQEWLNCGVTILNNGDVIQYNNESYTVSGLHYIENAKYFLANPLHAANKKSDNMFGTCTTVAMQMLLGYHNYNSDRRLIPEMSKEGERFLSETYGDLNSYPAFRSSPYPGLGDPSLGLSDAVFYEIFDRANGGSLLGQAIGVVTGGADDFLEEYADPDVQYSLSSAFYSEEDVLSDLNEGRPVVIGFDFVNKPVSAHEVVAYGYATVNGVFGYITHYGLSNGRVQMWVPASVIGFQARMNVSHEHDFTNTGMIKNNTYRTLECDTCGCGKAVAVFAGGDGEGSPFLISNEEQFRNIAYAYRYVNVPHMGHVKKINYSFKLTNDITLTGDWQPFEYEFTGRFDGDGHSITYSMVLDQGDINASKYQGLFGFVTGGVIEDLELKNCSITMQDLNTQLQSSSHVLVGILAGSVFETGGVHSVTVTNPTVNVNIQNCFAGCLAGSLNRTRVQDCAVNGGYITSYNGAVGGMAGFGEINYFSGGRCATVITKKNYAEGDQVGPIVGNSQSTSTVEDASTIYREGACVAAGTLITLADGTQKPVEELTGNERLLVWNFETGTFDSAPILFIDSDAPREYPVIELAFSDGTQVSVISEHGFWDVTLSEYVYLDQNAAAYVGHWFSKQTAEGGLANVQLTGVTIQTEAATAYSPVTEGHLCYFVNGMLSMPGGIEGLFNFFAVDPEEMRYDAEAKAADIAQYGLYTYEEFAAEYPVTEAVFDAFNAQYFKVAFGKGLLTEQRLQYLLTRYADDLGQIA